MWKGFPGGSDGKESAWNVGDLGLVLGLGRSPGGGHGSPLQYSYLENPINRVFWLHSMGLQRFRRNWATKNTAHVYEKLWIFLKKYLNYKKWISTTMENAFSLCGCSQQLPWNSSNRMSLLDVWKKSYEILLSCIMYLTGGRHCTKNPCLCWLCISHSTNFPPQVSEDSIY